MPQDRGNGCLMDTIFLSNRLLRATSDRSDLSYLFPSKSSAGRIEPLLKVCRPSAIRWRIISIVVDPLKSEAVWPLSHIRNEVAEIIPAVANFDSSTTIPIPSSLVVIGTSVSHRLPDTISGGGGAAFGGTMLSIS